MMHRSRRRQRGVSLIEALVAFGVMAFGMMAVVGMQSTLRANSDLARQRAEAVRIAQDTIEASRGFSTLTTATGRTAYEELVDSYDTPVPGTNTSYEVDIDVTEEPAVSGTVAAERRTLMVTVNWQDRAGRAQWVRLASAVAGIEPALAASLVSGANTGSALAQRGRHRGIPTGAAPVGLGISGYVPPGQSAGAASRVAWVFNNATGVITLCTTTALDTAGLAGTGGTINATCGSNEALLLTGVVRFATGGNPADSITSMADPAGPETPFGVQVNQVLTGGTSNAVACFSEAQPNNEVRYYCAVPIPAAANGSRQSWSGAIAFVSPLALASSVTSVSASEFRVCRYHSAASYANVSAPLLGQNFALIKAGSGTVAYTCPTDSSFQPRTWLHQPV
jgi:Tfp pilus assembly protein PilV